MIDPAAFQQAEVASTLRQLKTFAQNGPPAAELAGSKLLAFADEATAFAAAFSADPTASPHALLLAAGEATAQVEALQRELDCALDQLERLPIRVDPAAAPEGEDGGDADPAQAPDEG